MAESTGRDAYADCIQRVEIVGGGITPGDDLPFGVECFTDDSGTTFYGVWEVVGGVPQIEFYTVDAGGNLTVYVPTSTPMPCGGSDIDFEPTCFTDDSDTTFFGIWEMVGGALTMNFFTVDAGGNLTPYVPTSTPIPCSLNDIETRARCWLAIADGVGYSTDDQLDQIQFWDTTTSPPSLTATVWYNQTTNTTIAAPPPIADRISCEDQGPPRPILGYLVECQLFDLSLPLSAPGDFSDTVAANTTLTTDVATATLLRSQIQRAQERETEELAKGAPVTNVIITTNDGTVFEFPPSALQDGTGSVLTLTTADLITWPGPFNDTLANIDYGVLDDCGCRTVEMVQQVVSSGLQLTQIVDSSVQDVDGIKLEIPLPLVLGTTGPFPGPCPEAIQVLSLEDLCCNDSIIANTDITSTISAWADAATSLDNLIGGTPGVPIDGNNGDRIHEILNPLGVGPSWDGQGPTPGPIPFGGPSYQLDQQNSLPSFRFDGNPFPAPANGGDHLELTTGVVKGSPFQFFFLASFPADTVSTFIIGTDVPSNGVEDFQLQFSAAGALNLRYRGQTNTVLPNDIFIAPRADVANGEPHLITVNYEGTATNILNIFIDGQLRLSFNLVDDNPQIPGDPCALESDLIGLMRNAGDNGFPSGDVYEVIFTDGTLTPELVAELNAYIICKWGIDPSLATGGAGDLTLGAPGQFSAPTPFRRIIRADGTVSYLNTNNGLEFPIPPVPGLALCGFSGNALALDTELVCGDVGGVDTPLLRREFIGDMGSVVTFIDVDGNEVIPTSWTPGSCAAGIALDLAQVCGVVGGIDTPLLRREFVSDSGSVVEFITVDGAIVVPTSWTPGSCAAGVTLDLSDVCGVVGGVDTPLLRREFIDDSGSTVEFLTVDGVVVVPTSWTPGDCASGVTLDVSDVCGVVGGVDTPLLRREFIDDSGSTVEFLTVDGAIVVPTSWTPGICGADIALDVSDVCGVVGGVDTPLFRRELIDDTGTTIQFLTVDGAIVVPTSWTPGACAELVALDTELVCGVVGGVDTPLLRREFIDESGTTIEFLTVDGAIVVPTSWTPGDCTPSATTLEPRYDQISGAAANWTMGTDTYSATITAIAQGAVGSITVTTVQGTSTLLEGQTISFASDTPLTQPLTVDLTDAADIVAINWVEAV